MKLTEKTIFIWRSYGNVDVYLVDTLDKYDALLHQMQDICKDFSIPEDECKTVSDILRAIVVGTHESFEHGTGWSKLQ